jgi:hypothetical protein
MMAAQEKKLFSLRKVATESGVEFERLKREIVGRRHTQSALSRDGDIAVSHVQLRRMPSLAEADITLLSLKCPWESEVEEREVSVFSKPANIRLLLCADAGLRRYHVWVGNNKPFFKGMRLMIAPHPSASLKGFWHVIGPVPRFAGDKGFKIRWAQWKKARRP